MDLCSFQSVPSSGIMNVTNLSERELCIPFVVNVICIYAQKILEEYFKLNVGCISSKLEDKFRDLTSQFYPGGFCLKLLIT